MKAYLQQVRISSKKVNVVASLVRGKKVTDALTTLKFTPKRSAPVLAKLIASAAANAENNFKQDREKLFISKLIVNEGMTLKRGLPVSKGRWHPILKRSARISVELSPIVETKVEPKKDLKKSEKKVEKKAEPKVEKVESEKVAEKKVEKTEKPENNDSKK